MRSYDLAIIGSGPGGYVAGLYASRRKLKTCVIEKWLVGGTCLNRGCIPTKSLLHSASIINLLKESSVYGVEVDGVRVNFDRIMSRSADVTARLRTGVETLLKGAEVDLIRGEAVIVNKNTLKAGDEAISAKYIIIAAGSKVSGLANIQIDEVDIISSDGALSLKKMPESMVVVGGGVIGCEFATLYSALGAKVTIVEIEARILPALSREVSKKLEIIFKKRGIDVLTSSRVESISAGGGVKVKLSTGKTIDAEKALVSVGRAPDTNGLGAEKAGIVAERGKIAVDEGLRTKTENVYAIGDCVSGPQLAHKASYDAILAVDNICGASRKVDYTNVPNCVWTNPEIASVGLAEEEARGRHPDMKIAKFPYLGSGKAYLEGAVDGYVKIMGSPAGDIIGVEIMGEGACDLIAEAAVARTSGLKIGEWAQVVHGHPTLSEMFQEACHKFI